MEEVAACGRLTLRQQCLAASQQILSTDNSFVILMSSTHFAVPEHFQKRALVLVSICGKMLLIDLYKIPIRVALAVTAALIAGSVIASMLRAGPGPAASGKA